MLGGIAPDDNVPDPELEGEPGEVKPEPEPEEDKSLKFYQTGYQKAMAELKNIAPAAYDRVKDGRVPGSQPLATAQTQQEPPRDDMVLSDEEMGDPVAFARMIAKSVSQEMTQKMAQREYGVEYKQANGVLEGFVAENEVPQEELQKAFADVQFYGIDINTPGGPTKTATAVIDRLLYNRLLKEVGNRTSEVTIRAEQAAKDVLAASQPESGGVPSPRKLTKEENWLKQMQDAGPNDASKEVFG